MKTYYIHHIPGFEEWRDCAREAIMLGLKPSDVLWLAEQSNIQDNLFAEDEYQAEFVEEKPIFVPKAFLEMAQATCCHTDSKRFDLLYRILWRLNFENKNLMSFKTDNDIIAMTKMVKNVRRDAYKITAFLRFREVDYEGEEYFIAWYEPEFYTLERSMNFFKTRFKNMRWSILTPYRAAHWDKENLTLQDNPDPALYPKEDKIEQYWLGYYASIFNPARPKKEAMLSQMPKKYWKNMPETVLIPDLLRNADERAREMIKKQSQ